MARIASIYRYPVKGLTPEPLPLVTLTPGGTLPADRRYAIENGPTGFDPAAPAYFPKTRFLMLMMNERLARLTTKYDDATETLTVTEGDREVSRGDLRTPEGRADVEEFFAAYCAEELRGPPKILEGSNHSFSDVPRKVVSLINLASVAALEAAIGTKIDPLRFRANLYVSGWPAWHEFELMDQQIAIGASVRAKVFKRIVRCAATNVDPATGVRDLTIPKSLLRHFGHQDCGVYLDVLAGGSISVRDPVEPAHAA